MFIRYGNTLVNLDNTFCIILEEADDEDSYIIVAHSLQGIKCEIEAGTAEGVGEVMDRIFEAIQAGESAEVGK